MQVADCTCKHTSLVLTGRQSDGQRNVLAWAIALYKPACFMSELLLLLLDLSDDFIRYSLYNSIWSEVSLFSKFNNWPQLLGSAEHERTSVENVERLRQRD